jgi:predicted metal-dependent hydrolase
MKSFRVGDREVEYFIIRNANSKFVHLRFRPNLQLEVTVPKNQPVEVQKILRRKKQWIQKCCEELEASKRIFDGRRVLYKGKYYSVDISGAKTGKPRIGNATITLSNQEQKEVNLVLMNWMGKQTERFVRRRLKKYRANYNTLSISGIKKWAHCTRDGDLVFNWQLIGLPRNLADYVVLHETIHLTEFNHSKKFSYRLAQICPNFKAKEAMLKKFIID